MKNIFPILLAIVVLSSGCEQEVKVEIPVSDIPSPSSSTEVSYSTDSAKVTFDTFVSGRILYDGSDMLEILNGPDLYFTSSFEDAGVVGCSLDESWYLFLDRADARGTYNHWHVAGEAIKSTCFFEDYAEGGFMEKPCYRPITLTFWSDSL